MRQVALRTGAFWALLFVAVVLVVDLPAVLEEVLAVDFLAGAFLVVAGLAAQVSETRANVIATLKKRSMGIFSLAPLAGARGWVLA